MQYEGFVQACRALGIGSQDLRNRERLAHALEQRVDASNAPTIVRLLSQLADEDFDLAEVAHGYGEPRFEVAWTFAPWAPLELDEQAFYCGTDPDRLRAWLAAVPADVRRAILSFFDAPSNRFLLIADLGGASVTLSVQDASLELAYTLPERFDLDPAKARATGTELLRYLRIGTLFHEILVASREIDAEKIFSLLSGESSAFTAVARTTALAGQTYGGRPS